MVWVAGTGPLLAAMQPHPPPDAPSRPSPPALFPACSLHCKQCRAAFGGPVDPHLVLGGFPTAAAAFRNYSADATAFVVTLPLDPHPASRRAGLAWLLQ